MLFSSSVFLFVFLPGMLAGYYLLLRDHRRAQNLFLLAASLLFYAWGEPRFLPVMLLSVVMNYAFGLWVHRWRFQCRYLTLPVTAAVVCNLAILFLFKYLVFTMESLNALGLELTVPDIRLPIGISFFTFQALSYVLDVAMGKASVQRSVLDLGLYISFFPQLIAGPIVKYGDVADQIRGRRETWADFSSGCSRFLIGLSKKVLIANQVAAIADRAFSLEPWALTTPMAWLGAVCYTFQIYYDFSGYSDMAIGLGRMFGFRFLENFDHPYAATSITQFWRRWHISLGSWFRDYLYIPLGGNRVEKSLHIRNLLVVWLLTGLWHGANWTFLLWGLCYFVLLLLEKYLHLGKGWFKPLQRLYTLGAVNFLWVLFRSDTIAGAGSYLGAMVGLNGAAAVDPLCSFLLAENGWVLLFALLFSFPLAPWLSQKLEGRKDRQGVDLILILDVLYALALVILGIVSACYLVKGTYNPFIYFRF